MKASSLALGLVILSLGARAGAPEDLAGLSWLAGGWRGELGQAVIEEHWTKASGGMMLGVSRTVVGDKTVGFEFLRIEVRAEGVYYVAQPNGRAGTDFKLVKLEAESAVFENPEHDHPKIIRYRKGGDGSLTAQVEGDEGAQEFPTTSTASSYMVTMMLSRSLPFGFISGVIINATSISRPSRESG